MLCDLDSFPTADRCSGPSLFNIECIHVGKYERPGTYICVPIHYDTYFFRRSLQRFNLDSIPAVDSR